MEYIAREEVKKTKEELFLDRPFLNHLVKSIQAIDPDIGAFIVPETKIVIFFSSTYEIVIYKVRLNEENIETFPMEYHIKQVKDIMTTLNANLIPYKDLVNLQKSAARLNLKAIKQL